MNNLTMEESALCSLLVRKVKEYFQSEEHRTDFEKWYRDRYGKDYEWRNDK